MPSSDHNPLDSAGLFISFVCLVHCLALPVVVAVVPAAGLWLSPEDDHLAHVWLLAIAAPVSLTALFLGMRRLALWRWLGIGSIGLAMMLLGVLPVADDAYERALTVIGVSLLGIAHLGNWTTLHRRRAHA
jgi:hypothetical protein